MVEERIEVGIWINDLCWYCRCVMGAESQGEAGLGVSLSPRSCGRVPASVSSVQSLSPVRLFATPWTAARLFITNSRSLLKLMSIESVMPSNHLILWELKCQALLYALRLANGTPESQLCHPVFYYPRTAYPCGDQDYQWPKGRFKCLFWTLPRFSHQVGSILF